MGNKKKIGKARRDKFYQLAKESGYRARSAFKLIQLNRKFEFLQKSRVVIDLCAAPGGWLQVASENCPMSSIIVGVDLVAIKPIRNCKTLIDDITTDKCRQDLRKELHTWKADCVLNDGAPNVGKNWVHDAFQQVQLTLYALKLATEFLKKGGWFVTKVFRSKDYNSLLWVLQQLFRNVHATKPQASRNESAEIFVVCQYYLAPDKIDPKFLDPKSVFKDVEPEPSQAINLMHPEKQTRHRDGYPEGDYTLFHTLKVSDFLQQKNFMELLADASEIIFDDKAIENHELTTDEIKECFKDIKVLGKREIRIIMAWRKKLTKEMEAASKKKGSDDDSESDKEKTEDKKSGEENDTDLEELEAKLEDLKGEERKALKRKIKKTRRERSKLQHKMDMKLVLPNDKIDTADDRELFDLERIKSKRQLETVEDGDINAMDDDYLDEEDIRPAKKTKVSWDRDDVKDYNLPDELDEIGGVSDDDEELESVSDDESDGEISLDEVDDEEMNPLLLGRPSKKSKTDMWFSKESFAGIDDDADEDVEIEKMAEAYTKKGGVIKGINDKKKENNNNNVTNGDSADIADDNELETMDTVTDDVVANDDHDDDDDDSDSESSSDSDNDNKSDSDSDYDSKEFYKQMKQNKKDKKETESVKDKNRKSKKDGDGFEVVPVENTPSLKLDPQGLALGAALVSSRKRRREIIDSGYHRYMFNDTNLPEWFVKDEQKYHRVSMPVTKGDIQEYKMKMRAVDANPIKKIAEARARKKRKEMKRLEKARKKADNINDTEDVTDREKWQQIKQVYKKAGLLGKQKRELTYVISKKGLAGKRVARPNGVKGPYKVVDGRLKKDTRAKKRADDRKKGKGKRRR